VEKERGRGRLGREMEWTVNSMAGCENSATIAGGLLFSVRLSDRDRDHHRVCGQHLMHSADNPRSLLSRNHNFHFLRILKSLNFIFYLEKYV